MKCQCTYCVKGRKRRKEGYSREAIKDWKDHDRRFAVDRVSVQDSDFHFPRCSKVGNFIGAFTV